MGKKGGNGAAGGSKHKAKKPAQKAKKAGQFKSLTKQETRQVVVHTERKAGVVQQKAVPKPKNKQVKRVPDEFRNFDERMAATRMKKVYGKAAPAPSNPVVAAPSFVMAAPTFQFNMPAPAQEAPREIEGFQGFLTAMQEPATAPQPAAPRENRKQKVVLPRNVFAVLDDEPRSQQQAPVVAAPTFLQPATFTFHTSTFGGAVDSSSGSLTSLQRSLMGPSAATPSPFAQAIDPDL